MSNLTEIGISFQKRNLEKFKEQVRSLPKDGQLAQDGKPTKREWVFFIMDIHKKYKENKEYIAALEACPDDTIGLTVSLLNKKDAGVRAFDQMVPSLAKVVSQMPSVLNPDEIYAMNVPHLEVKVTGKDLALLKDGGIEITRGVLTQNANMS